LERSHIEEGIDYEENRRLAQPLHQCQRLWPMLKPKAMATTEDVISFFVDLQDLQ
jgi:hypothetical protein